MHYDMLCGIISGIDGTIAEWIKKNVFIAGYDTVDKLTKLSQAIRPVYQAAVQAGYPVYHIDDPASARTLERVVAQTGVSKEAALNYLASLEEMAMGGTIGLDVWNPNIPKASPGPLETVSTKAAGVVTGAINTGFNKLLFTAGAVMLLYLIARNAMRRF